MNSISIFLKRIRNHIPYFLLIGIYFIFVNLEARKEKDNSLNAEIEKMIDDKSRKDANNLRITIPVIPYKQ